jgi:hypothetical protein
MVNHSNSNVLVNGPPQKVKGKTKAKHTMIAALIARGDSVKDVAKHVKMSESRIYHLLSDEDSFVSAEITRILNELFASNDRHLINIYRKVLQKLDTMLSSSEEEKQYRAIDRIIKIYFTRTAKNAIIQQYFGGQPQPQQIVNVDDIIVKMRKERGLSWPPDHKDSSDFAPKDSSDSSSHDSSPDNPSTDNSHPDAPSSGTSTPAFEAFLESIK